MKAILCRYLPPTTHKGARVKATMEGVKSVIVPYHDSQDPYLAAAAKMIEDNGGGPVHDWHRGGLPDGSEVFVYVPGPSAL